VTAAFSEDLVYLSRLRRVKVIKGMPKATAPFCAPLIGCAHIVPRARDRHNDFAFSRRRRRTSCLQQICCESEGDYVRFRIIFLNSPDKTIIHAFPRSITAFGSVRLARNVMFYICHPCVLLSADVADSVC